MTFYYVDKLPTYIICERILIIYLFIIFLEELTAYIFLFINIAIMTKTVAMQLKKNLGNEKHRNYKGI